MRSLGVRSLSRVVSGRGVGRVSTEEHRQPTRDTFYGYDRKPFFTGVSAVDAAGTMLSAVRALMRGQPAFPRELTFVVANGAIQIFLTKGYTAGKRSLLGQHALPARIELSDPYLQQAHILIEVKIDDATYVMPRAEALDLQSLAAESA
jgi:hypothetical protein